MTTETNASPETTANSPADSVPCVGCGYDLRGSAQSDRCPECGEAVAVSVLARRTMTQRDLALLACRVLAVWMGLSGLVSVVQLGPHWIGAISSPPSGGGSPLLVVALVVVSAVLPAPLIWFAAPWVSRRMVREDGLAVLPGAKDPVRVWTAAAMVVIGLLYIARALWGLGHLISLLIYPPEFGFGADDYVTHTIVNLVIGVVFVIGARSIGRFIVWLRRAGTTASKERL